MADDSSFLHRWSRRKHEAARSAQAPAAPAPPAPMPSAAAVAPAASAAPVAVTQAPPAPVEPPLPPVESLTLESDFTPFLSAKVDETVKRAAMRKLFSDPHFNVMDGLDVYIDDYSKPDPLPEGMLEKLANVYKAIEEKVPEPETAQTVAPAGEAQGAAPPAHDTPSPPSEPTVEGSQDPDERQG